MNDFLGHRFKVNTSRGSSKITGLEDTSKIYAAMTLTQDTEPFSLETEQGKIVFWDTPGINYKKSNFSLEKMREISEQFPHSHILVIPENKIRIYRGSHFPSAIHSLLKIFTEREIYEKFQSNFHIIINVLGVDRLQETKKETESLLEACEESFKEKLQELEETKEKYEKELKRAKIELPEEYEDYKNLIEDSNKLSYETRQALKTLWTAKERRIFAMAFKLIKKGIVHLHYWNPLEDVEGFKETFFQSLAKAPKAAIPLESSAEL